MIQNITLKMSDHLWLTNNYTGGGGGWTGRGGRGYLKNCDDLHFFWDRGDRLARKCRQHSKYSPDMSGHLWLVNNTGGMNWPGGGGMNQTSTPATDSPSSKSTCESQYCGEPPWPRGSVLGLRPPGLQFRILCLEDSVIWFISPSSGGSPGPV